MRSVASLIFTVLAGVTLSFSAAADETSDDGAGLPVWLIWTQADDDGDGVNNVQDAFPKDASETLDTDDDGIGNNADEDDDGDGVADDIDLFPLDPSESEDFDGDGIGNNADTDDDGDGVSDSEEIGRASCRERV